MKVKEKEEKEEEQEEEEKEKKEEKRAMCGSAWTGGARIGRA